MTLLESYRRGTDDLLRELKSARKNLATEKTAFESATQRQSAIEESRQIVQSVAESVQRQAHKRIADVVSKCLEAVFDEPYELLMNFESKRGRTEVSFAFRRGELVVDPVTASGGGVVDVASFALRLAALLLSKPPLRRFLALDEPLKFLSAEYRDRAREMIETVSREMGVQILLVTHIDELRIGKVVEL